ncbi:hypothetical protein PVAP13_2KG228805 [Panicum virgatum]|uniref:Uncharacterized protein n=1 Tax=Panicum virgatum TaxID=38727 RepID=A0A8T0WDD5_PANVG|nr:hypothetical protein PVAP13_2KG228805 [Panicum virgatum]
MPKNSATENTATDYALPGSAKHQTAPDFSSKNPSPASTESTPQARSIAASSERRPVCPESHAVKSGEERSTHAAKRSGIRETRSLTVSGTGWIGGGGGEPKRMESRGDLGGVLVCPR